MIETRKTPHSLYAIEFLRVFFIFFIILGHIMERYSSVKDTVLNFFNTKYMQGWFCVEFFFIIGGFFLYLRIQKTTSVNALVKRIYLRLLPALVFVFCVCLLLGTVHRDRFPLILTMTTGLTIPGEATGWGDWYVGSYFWASCLYVGLFMLCRKQAFIWTFVLMYITICLKFNAPYDGFMKTYYTIVGNQFIRAIYSIGLGISAAYLAEKVDLKKNAFTISIFTILEIMGFLSVFYYIARSSHIHFNFWEMEIVFALLLISISKSFGWVSLTLNSISKIQYISRYTYSIFLGHIIFIKQLISHQSYGLSGTSCALIILGGATIAGVFEYHIVEKKIMPWIIKQFVKE
uniref:acyltransferase family protein n=1 Tax=Candidatus Scatocola faecipullorum TaxID=2840917 RepID=UPI0040255848